MVFGYLNACTHWRRFSLHLERPLCRKAIVPEASNLELGRSLFSHGTQRGLLRSPWVSYLMGN